VRFLSLSDYSDVDLIHPTFLGVEMGKSKENNVAILFSKVSYRRCHKINKKVWDKARERLDLAQPGDYTNVRGKNTMARTQHMCDMATIRIRSG
jgi:hypothetical protein